MSDEARLLDALSDGRWHNHQSLYRLGLMVHSRVAVLRKRGHSIACRRVGNHYEYRLETPLEESDGSATRALPGLATPPSGSSSALGAAALSDHGDRRRAAAPSTPEQLSIDEACGATGYSHSSQILAEWGHAGHWGGREAAAPAPTNPAGHWVGRYTAPPSPMPLNEAAVGQALAAEPNWRRSRRTIGEAD